MYGHGLAANAVPLQVARQLGSHSEVRGSVRGSCGQDLNFTAEDLVSVMMKPLGLFSGEEIEPPHLR
jgi:hypothetical protein